MADLPPVVLATLAGLFTWGVTALGAASVFLTRDVSRRSLDALLGFACGVMIAASYWSLLAPALELSENLAVPKWFPAAAGFPEATMAGAIALTVGIGLQNFPEGIAVAMPLRREGLSQLRSFWYGQLSGLVEPIAAAVGAITVVYARAILPYAMAYAAGAMIFVVLEDAIPEAERSGNIDLAAMAAIVGFVVMMVLDVSLG